MREDILEPEPIPGVTVNGRVLIAVEDEEVSRRVRQEVAGEGLPIVTAQSSEGVMRAIENEDPAAVVLDERFAGGTGEEVLRRIHAARPALPVVWLAASSEATSVHKGLAAGAVDFAPQPLHPTRLVTVVRNAIARGCLETRVFHLTRELRHDQGVDRLLGRCEAMRETLRLLRRAAGQDFPVLLEGEVGTGRERAARAVHASGRCRSAPFVSIPCEARAAGELEAELFGVDPPESGPPRAPRRGRLEEVDGGTCFLSEIGASSRAVQEGLLRLLREGVVTRIGGSRARAVRVRLLASTARDLREAVASGTFSRPFYEALSTFPIRLPALREREGDVALLARSFCDRFAAKHGKSLEGIEDDAMRILESHDWPGNVGELERVIERSVLLETRPRLTVASLPPEIVTLAGRPDHRSLSLLPLVMNSKEDIVCFDEEERRIILRALELTSWNVQEAAQRLGIGRATIYRKIDRYDLRRFRPPRAGSVPARG